MKIDINGVIRDMTEEEQEAYTALSAQIPVAIRTLLEEKVERIESMVNQIMIALNIESN